MKRERKPWPQPELCGYCKPGLSFFAHADEGELDEPKCFGNR